MLSLVALPMLAALLFRGATEGFGGFVATGGRGGGASFGTLPTTLACRLPDPGVVAVVAVVVAVGVPTPGVLVAEEVEGATVVGVDGAVEAEPVLPAMLTKGLGDGLLLVGRGGTAPVCGVLGPLNGLFAPSDEGFVVRDGRGGGVPCGRSALTLFTPPCGACRSVCCRAGGVGVVNGLCASSPALRLADAGDSGVRPRVLPRSDGADADADADDDDDDMPVLRCNVAAGEWAVAPAAVVGVSVVVVVGSFASDVREAALPVADTGPVGSEMTEASPLLPSARVASGFLRIVAFRCALLAWRLSGAAAPVASREATDARGGLWYCGGERRCTSPLAGGADVVAAVAVAVAVVPTSASVDEEDGPLCFTKEVEEEEEEEGEGEGGRRKKERRGKKKRKQGRRRSKKKRK